MMNKDNLDMGIDGNTGLENTTWWRPDGSDHFTIREVLISPEGFSVRTTDGRLIGGEVMDTYIQSDTPITGHEREQSTPKINPKQLEGIDAAAIVDDNENGKGKSFGNLRYSHPGAKFKQPSQQRMIRKEPDPLNDPLENPIGKEPEGFEVELDDISYGMIDRVLGKVNPDELVSMNINPIEKVDNGVVTLVRTLNIKRSEIKAYTVAKITEHIEKMIDTAMDVYLEALMGPEEVTEEQPQ